MYTSHSSQIRDNEDCKTGTCQTQPACAKTSSFTEDFKQTIESADLMNGGSQQSPDFMAEQRRKITARKISFLVIFSYGQ
jgi:DNA-binding IscR family transcriptional regulator